jgi:ribosomal protein S18 acetylase RimI-like enzyme
MAIDDLSRLRRATLGDARRIALVLARAFQDDPLMRYTIPDVAQRRQLLPWLIGLNVRYGCRYGEIYATQGYEGAAIWLSPGHTSLTLWRMLRAGMFVAPFRAPWPILRRLARVEGRTRDLHTRYAPGPHWYLSQIGVDPLYQRQGVASRLLRPMLARFDAAGLPCYLETQHAANVAFYQRHGFRVVAEDTTPYGGPQTWVMLRALHG